MKRFALSALVVTAVLLQACSSEVYNNSAYLNQAGVEGKRVAILPAEVELTGRMPADFSEAKKQQTEESESILIQQEIYNQYLFKSKPNRKKKKYVELMNVDQVNSKLREKGIDTRKSWTMNPDSLGKLVGADMVLKVRVKKNRIMSDAAAFGIGVATTVLGNILNRGNGTNTSVNNSAKTYNMFFDATLTDINNHAVITKFTHDSNASWSQPPEKIIESSGRKIVRKGGIYVQK
ncbi:hypothetical protein WG906_14510 [Pedobacter sp. P351]|uniref:hypothetical protein n=1 Tax=Pedobacter superstes TaxID=3133441 RepID=UPI0030A3A618